MATKPQTTTSKLSAEVRDDNPYSRLMALQRMGVVEDYEQIRRKSVAIIGAGGVGSVAAEMLTRCGIGKLLLFDYDTVEMANMNRLFFRPEQQGKLKVVAAKETLENINPDVTIVPCGYNVTTVQNYDAMLRDLSSGGVAASSPVDLLLCCVDNFQARISVNQACLELSIPWIESGVAENAVSGHIQLMLPGVTPCYECAPPLVVATGMPEAKRVGVCAASLPTTMGIVAGLLAQNALKYLLKFGQVSEYVGYDALKDHFPEINQKPNCDCTNSSCIARQKEYSERVARLGPSAHPLHQHRALVEAAKQKPIEHKENQWGIEVQSGGGDEHEPQQSGASSNNPKLVPMFAPDDNAGRATSVAGQRGAEEFVAQPSGDTSLEELMAKLKSTTAK